MLLMRAATGAGSLERMRAVSCAAGGQARTEEGAVTMTVLFEGTRIKRRDIR